MTTALFNACKMIHIESREILTVHKVWFRVSISLKRRERQESTSCGNVQCYTQRQLSAGGSQVNVYIIRDHSSPRLNLTLYFKDSYWEVTDREVHKDLLFLSKGRRQKNTHEYQ